MIRLSFHGAVRTVTGSVHMIDNGRCKVLLDCGLYQGRRQESIERNNIFPFAPSDVSALILSHAHIDHCGNIPNLAKQGFEGEIHCTRATANLTNLMMRDSAHIQEKDTEYVNKVRARHGEPPVEPLYTLADAEKAQECLTGHSLNRWFVPAAGFRVMFREAGHILGSALTVLNLSENGRNVRVCYACDLGHAELPLLRDPYTVTDADILVIESTYGGRLHGNLQEAEAKLTRVVTETAARGGKVLIPAFALERSQELIYRLHRLVISRQVPDIPIFVDSPLAVDATDIFRIHPECFSPEINEFMRQVDDPFGFRQLRYVREVEESKKLNQLQGPLVIIAASGMAEHGRILHHLKKNIGDPNNTVLLVSYQAENTLGRRLANGDKVVRIFGEEHERLCRVEIIEEFSAHADHKELVEWVKKGKDCWRRVFIVHGDEPASLALAQALRDEGLANVVVPERDQAVEI